MVGQKQRQRSGLVFIVLVALAVVAVISGIEAVRRFSTESQPGVTRTSVNQSTDFPRTLRDANADELTIKERPRRIASQTLGTDEILLAICAPERLVAFSKLASDPNYSNVVDAAKSTNAPAVQNAEDILQLRPDLIFVASYSRAEVVQQLQTAGAPVFRFANFDRIEDIKENIRIVGQATGDDVAAANLITRIDAELARIKQRIPPSTAPPRVMSYSAAGYTAGGKTLFDDIIRAAGATNITADNGIDGFRKISAEQVAAWQPDFIIAGANAGRFDETRNELLANPALAATPAARAGHIVIMDTRYFLTVSHHVVRAVDMLVNELYKDRLYKDMNAR